MYFKIFTIKFDSQKEIFNEEELNNFLLNKKVKNYSVHFFENESDAYWSVFIEYEIIIEKQGKQKEFTEQDQIFYEKLREWRKEASEKAGVPVYIIATNKQLKALIRMKPKTVDMLKTIDGFGKKKIEYYGKEILELVTNYYGDNND